MKETIATVSSHNYDSLYHIPTPSEADGDMPPAHTLSNDHTVPEAAIEQLERDGVVCLRNVLDETTVSALRDESDRAVADAGPNARFVNTNDDPEVFYYEFNLWRHYPVQKEVLFNSHIADVGAALMRSSSVTLYYTNTFVKDGGAREKVTPWHEDASYSRFVGNNVINLNISFDRMPAETTLKFLQASHERSDPLYIGPTFEPGVEYDQGHARTNSHAFTRRAGTPFPDNLLGSVSR